MSKNEFLPLLLDSLTEGLTLTQIANKLRISKQALNYHIKRFRRLGVISRTQSYPYAIYELTPLGERVKENIRYPDKCKPTYRCHALQLGFDIIDFGTFNMIETKKRRISRMNGWSYASEMQGKHHVKIQETGLMIVSCPDIYTHEPDQAWARMYTQAINTAQKYCDFYGMKLKPMKIIRRGQKSLLGSSVLAKLLGKGKLSEDMYIDASEGTDELEEFAETNITEQFTKVLKLPEKIDKLENYQLENAKIMHDFSKNIELHLDVLNGIKKGINELRDAVRELKNAANNNN